jgi:hypothetical protein
VEHWRLTVRNGPRVERARFTTLDAALTSLEERMDELTPQARRQSIEVLRHRYDAARMVSVRGEVAGPSRVMPTVRGGVDLRGEGSAEAFTGRFRRALVALSAGETAYDGLRRVLLARRGGA